MPTHEHLGTDDCKDLQDRRKPTIQPDKKQAIVIRESNAAVHFTPQNDQLMSEQRTGIINSHAVLGGLHHHYVRV